jgi:hypothetical protein
LPVPSLITQSTQLPPRYFDKDLRKVVYDGGSYWSSPVRPGYQLGQSADKVGGRRQQQQQKQFLKEAEMKMEEHVTVEPRGDLDIEILSLLDHRMLGKIKRDFKRHKYPLKQEEFVDIMIKSALLSHSITQHHTSLKSIPTQHYLASVTLLIHSPC